MTEVQADGQLVWPSETPRYRGIIKAYPVSGGAELTEWTSYNSRQAVHQALAREDAPPALVLKAGQFWWTADAIDYLQFGQVEGVEWDAAPAGWVGLHEAALLGPAVTPSGPRKGQPKSPAARYATAVKLLGRDDELERFRIEVVHLGATRLFHPAERVAELLHEPRLAGRASHRVVPRLTVDAGA